MAQAVTFRFECQGLKAGLFQVVRFSGDEGLSQLYQFEIELRSDRDRTREFSLEDMVSKLCRLTIACDDDHEPRRIHGILRDFEVLRERGSEVLYRAVLVPRLWELSLFEANEIYLDQTVEQVLETVLDKANLVAGEDFAISLDESCETREYRCQYRETHFDYVSRLMEREGIYYFFEQDDPDAGDALPDANEVVDITGHEKLRILDSHAAHGAITGDTLSYDPNSGLTGVHDSDRVLALVKRMSRLPQKVIIRDYNDDTPSTEIVGEQDVAGGSLGEVNIFGLNVVNSAEGTRLARVHAERLHCQGRQILGESTVSRLASGFQFSLEDHFRDDFNITYLVAAVHHQGRDQDYLNSISATDADEPYWNSFSALDSETPYRPEQTAPVPRITGTLDATVDGESAGVYAELDDEGRYLIRLPFDRSDRDDGKASHRIRMSQILAGDDEGAHFPLRKGAHVLLSFIGGDPDRPVITGAMPNAAQISIINAASETRARIQTASGNFLEFEDMEGQGRLSLHTPRRETSLHLGVVDDEGDGVHLKSQGLERKHIAGGQQNTVLTRATDLATNAEDDAYQQETEVFSFTRMAETGDGLYPGRDLSNGAPGSRGLTLAEERSGRYIVNRISGVQYNYNDGPRFNYGGDNSRDFFYGPSYEVRHKDNDGHTLGSGTELTAFFDGVTPSGLAGYAGTATSLEEVLRAASVTLGKHDSVNMQEGNIYDFGGYWNYNLGNCYVETHTGQSAKLNKKPAKMPNPADMLNPEAMAEYALQVADAHARDRCPVPPFAETRIDGEDIELDINNTLMEKTLGDAYSYRNGKAIEISVGTTESHSEGASYEYSYSDLTQKLTTKSISKDDVDKEWKYHPSDGTSLLSYDESNLGGTVSFSTKFMPTLSMEMDFSTLSTAINFGINSFSADFTASSIGVSMKFLDVAFSPPSCQTITNNGTSLSFQGPLKVDTDILALEAIQTSLVQGTLTLNSGQVGLKSYNAELKNSAAKITSAMINLIL